MSSSTFSGTGDHLSFSDFLDDILVNSPPQTPLFFSSGSSPFSNNGNTTQSELNNPTDEIKKKRKISNRESARRSRMRKQKHLEDVKNQVTRYKMVNHQLMNRLRLVNHNEQIVVQENQRLVLGSVMLEQRLHRLHRLLAAPEIHHTLLPSAWPCSNNVTVVNDQNHPSLVTL